MNNAIFIDTSNNKIITVGLRVGDKDFSLSREFNRKTQVVLPLIEQILKENKLGLGDINEICVNCGPGSFTGLRVGVAIANTLGYLLNIPINGKEVGQTVEPSY